MAFCGRYSGGADETRTRDPLLAKQVLYQLSYDPSVEGLMKERSSKFTLCDQLRPRCLELQISRMKSKIQSTLRPSDTVL